MWPREKHGTCLAFRGALFCNYTGKLVGMGGKPANIHLPASLLLKRQERLCVYVWLWVLGVGLWKAFRSLLNITINY